MPDLRDHVALLRDSLLHVTGRDLLDYPGANADPEEAAYEAPFALLSHDTREDPIFVYGNRTALRLFELDWNAFIALPSRLSAEPLARDERQRLLDRVTQYGYIDDYSGVRVSATGRRFTITGATVWNLTDEGGTYAGQAAMFSQWTPVDTQAPE